MTDKPDGGPAFPVVAHGTIFNTGMSYRAWVAGQELSGMGRINPSLPNDPASTSVWPQPEELAARRAKWAVLQADALIAELAK